MDYYSSSSTSRERRRAATASRRTARSSNNIEEEQLHPQHNYNNNNYNNNNHHHQRRIKKNASSPPPNRHHRHQQPSLEKTFLSSLSQALTNIDRHNNDYFSSNRSLDDAAATTNDGVIVGDYHRDNNDNDVVISFFNNRNNSNSSSQQQQQQHSSPYNTNNTNIIITKQPPPSHYFSSYLKFTRVTIYTLLLFTFLYMLLLFCTLPMISYSNIDTLETDDVIIAIEGSGNGNSGNGSNGSNGSGGYKQHIKQGASFQRIRGHEQYIRIMTQTIPKKWGTLKDRAVQWEEQTKVDAREEAVLWQEKERWVIDSAIEKFGGGGGSGSGSDGSGNGDNLRMSQLLEEVVDEFEGEMEEEEEEDNKSNSNVVGNKGHDEHWAHALEAWDEVVATTDTADEVEGEEEEEGAAANNKDANGNNNNKRRGFIVLGMHRSGTSMLSGLLVEGFGYETGGPLIMPNFDNEKGFYERIDVVLQNDEFFNAQRMGWSFNVFNYDSEKALRDKLQGTITFDEGKRALQFLNNRHKTTLPYLQKDPRMCIALPTWLTLLEDEPAIVFTYRHPLEVAMSLKKRESSITLEHGLRLWIVYNMRAIQNSVGLCRVFSTNEAVIKDPTGEVQRIKNQLTDTCNVLPPPTSLIPQTVVDSFIDPNLQHNSNERKNEEKTSSMLKDFGDGCIAKEFDSDYERGSSNYEAEKQIFLMAMQVFCDFENGKAYEVDYEWPDLVHWHRPARIN